MSQFLTAVFELRPSKRKAAALERVRASAEKLFWQTMEAQKPVADTLAAIENTKDRKQATRALQAVLFRSVMAASVKLGLSESVTQGMVRDIMGAVSSHIELRAKGHAADWPTPLNKTDADHATALDRFNTASTRDHENEARDSLALVSKMASCRPLTMARSRDALLLRQGPAGKLVLVLNILRAADPRSRQVLVKPGIDAVTGEATKAHKSNTRLLIPVLCGKWHEQKFLAGKAVLRSSLIVRRDDRWFLCAQFEMNQTNSVHMTGARLGIDRGVVNPVATAIVNATGAVIAAREPAGQAIGKAILLGQERRKIEQRRRGISSRKYARQLDHHLHHLANDIVRDAKAFGAQVVMEKLDGFKSVIRTARPKGARRNAWQKLLKSAQLGKLETIVNYKLRLAGIPLPVEVFAARTSITCPACGHCDPKSRIAQDSFACTACTFGWHADTVAAVNTARRDVALRQHKKGANFAALERDIVQRLRSLNGCGLGPLAAGLSAANGFVAAHASADAAYELSLLSLTVTAGQKTEHVVQNGRKSVFPAGNDPYLVHRKRKNVQLYQVVGQGRLL